MQYCTHLSLFYKPLTVLFRSLIYKLLYFYDFDFYARYNRTPETETADLSQFHAVLICLNFRLIVCYV